PYCAVNAVAGPGLPKPSATVPAVRVTVSRPGVVRPLSENRTVRLPDPATTSAPLTVPRLRVRSDGWTEAGSTASVNVTSMKVSGAGTIVPGVGLADTTASGTAS